MTTATKKEVAKVEPPDAKVIETVLLGGDLSQLIPEQRLNYYKSVCESLKLNPLTKPFEYIVLDNRMVLYATKDCAAQLRRKQHISLKIVKREEKDGVYVVTARASMGMGSTPRTDESIGAVPMELVKDGKTYPLTAVSRANSMMKAETKAKRRVTLSICGLGMLDESEVDELAFGYDQTVPNAIIERNVREATAHAVGEPAKEEGVTENNYGEVICHVGKAEGNILGKAVKDIHPKILQWLRDKWIPKLPPVPNEKDARLRDAIVFAMSKIETGEVVAEELAEPPNKVDLANSLIERAKELILTPAQFHEALIRYGFMPEGQMLVDQPLGKLVYLSRDGWDVFKQAHEAEVKPKTKPPKPIKKRRDMSNDNPFQ